VIKQAPALSPEKIIVMNMSGRGDKDVEQAARFILAGEDA